MFSHERLDAYNVALAFARQAVGVGSTLKPALRDQLTRACESVVLNIAEGAQQKSGAAAKRHYRVALGSAAECAAALDLAAIHTRVPEEARELINRVGAMLNKMAR